MQLCSFFFLVLSACSPAAAALLKAAAELRGYAPGSAVSGTVTFSGSTASVSAVSGAEAVAVGLRLTVHQFGFTLRSGADLALPAAAGGSPSSGFGAALLELGSVPAGGAGGALLPSSESGWQLSGNESIVGRAVVAYAASSSSSEQPLAYGVVAITGEEGNAAAASPEAFDWALGKKVWEGTGAVCVLRTESDGALLGYVVLAGGSGARARLLDGYAAPHAGSGFSVLASLSPSSSSSSSSSPKALQIHTASDPGGVGAAGGVFSPNRAAPRGLPCNPQRRAGDLGNINAEGQYRAAFSEAAGALGDGNDLRSLVGRACVVRAGEDLGDNADLGEIIAQGVVALANPDADEQFATALKGKTDQKDYACAWFAGRGDPPPKPAAASVTASARLVSVGGSGVGGEFNFTENTYDGSVSVNAVLTGTKAAHGVQVFKYGDARPGEDGLPLLGPNFNPENLNHGLPPNARYVGDMGNTAAGGRLDGTFRQDKLSLTDAERSIVGRAVVVRERVDDGSPPDGNAGAVLAFGVVAVDGRAARTLCADCDDDESSADAWAALDLGGGGAKATAVMENGGGGTDLVCSLFETSGAEQDEPRGFISLRPHPGEGQTDVRVEATARSELLEGGRHALRIYADDGMLRVFDATRSSSGGGSGGGDDSDQVEMPVAAQLRKHHPLLPCAHSRLLGILGDAVSAGDAHEVRYRANLPLLRPHLRSLVGRTCAVHAGESTEEDPGPALLVGVVGVANPIQSLHLPPVDTDAEAPLLDCAATQAPTPDPESLALADAGEGGDFGVWVGVAVAATVVLVGGAFWLSEHRKFLLRKESEAACLRSVDLDATHLSVGPDGPARVLSFRHGESFGSGSLGTAVVDMSAMGFRPPPPMPQEAIKKHRTVVSKGPIGALKLPGDILRKSVRHLNVKRDELRARRNVNNPRQKLVQKSDRSSGGLELHERRKAGHEDTNAAADARGVTMKHTSFYNINKAREGWVAAMSTISTSSGVAEAQDAVSTARSDAEFALEDVQQQQQQHRVFVPHNKSHAERLVATGGGGHETSSPIAGHGGSQVRVFSFKTNLAAPAGKKASMDFSDVAEQVEELVVSSSMAHSSPIPPPPKSYRGTGKRFQSGRFTAPRPPPPPPSATATSTAAAQLEEEEEKEGGEN